MRTKFNDDSGVVPDAWVASLPDDWSEPDRVDRRWSTAAPGGTNGTGFLPNIVVTLDTPEAEIASGFGTLLSDHEWDPPGDYSRRIRVVTGLLAGRSFVEVVAVFTSPGSQLIVSATAGRADWQRLAPTFDEVIASVQPAPSDAEPDAAPESGEPEGAER